MNDYVFTEQVKKKFRYLVDGYGYSVVDEVYDPEAFGNSLVQFRSDSVDIFIVLDRGRVLIDIAPYPNVSNHKFGLPTIIEFLAPEAGEMSYIYPEKPGDYYEKIDWQIDRLTTLLQQYAVPVLNGEFSDWQELDERRQKQALRAYRKLAGKDPIKIDSEELKDEFQQEIDRRKVEQDRSTGKSSSCPKQGQESIPWWAFWRRQS